MSDEDDYMSDKFLTSDVRPSLIQDRGNKRKVEVVNKKNEHLKRQREERLTHTGANRDEQLQESLKRPIEAENKGFQMLAKMGYKTGQALGKERDSATDASKRLTEPIGISIKSDRGGLGREAAILELKEKRRQLREQRLYEGARETVSAEEFRRRATEKAEERFVGGALRRCQLTCENLDTEAQVATPAMSWFWPERLVEAEVEGTRKEDEVSTSSNTVASDDMDEENDEETYTNVEKLDMLTNYLRTSYTFCFWCGVRYNDVKDLDDNCPGLTRDEH